MVSQATKTKTTATNPARIERRRAAVGLAAIVAVVAAVRVLGGEAPKQQSGNETKQQMGGAGAQGGGGWVSGATPSAAAAKTDMPEVAGPPPLWVRLHPGHLAQPIATQVEDVEGHGPCVVIPETATPIVATRLLHEADARGLPCQDRRQGHRPVYATRPARGAKER